MASSFGAGFVIYLFTGDDEVTVESSELVTVFGSYCLLVLFCIPSSSQFLLGQLLLFLHSVELTRSWLRVPPITTSLVRESQYITTINIPANV